MLSKRPGNDEHRCLEVDELKVRRWSQLSYLAVPRASRLERYLREVPESEQPLMRLERLGPSALSTSELLHLLLDARTDPLLPMRLLSTWRTLNEMGHASPLDLLRADGMTRLRSARVRAALELGKRALSEQLPQPVIIRSPNDAAQLLLPEMAGLEQEQMRVILLNTKNGVIGLMTVYQGSVHTTVVRVSELFREAVRQNCTSIIVAHNHPSGDPTPSPEDLTVTKEIVHAGTILDIETMDHLILGGNHWVSLKERRMGFA